MGRWSVWERLEEHSDPGADGEQGVWRASRQDKPRLEVGNWGLSWVWRRVLVWGGGTGQGWAVRLLDSGLPGLSLAQLRASAGSGPQRSLPPPT